MLLEQVLTILILEEILILMILVMMGIKMEKVLETDLPINTPTHKMSVGLHYNKGKFYGAVYGRYVQKYDFFSGQYCCKNTKT
jgi:hypothetical protein